VRDVGSTAKELMQDTEKNDQNVSRLDNVSVSELRNGSLPANVST
jgi:chromatin assembly factor 1 subunit A